MGSETSNSFASRATLASGNKSYTIFRLPALTEKGFALTRLPFSLKILLENLLRREDGVNVTAGVPPAPFPPQKGVEWFDVAGRRIRPPRVPGVYFVRSGRGRPAHVVVIR